MGIKMNFFQDNSNIDRIGALFKFKDVSDKTQTHLKNVYGNLFLCTGVCALGMYLNAFTVLQGFLWTVGIMIGMGYLTFKVADRSAPESERIGYLWAISSCMGFLVGPAMHQIAEVSPEILIQAISYTCIMFGSFSAMALFSKRRSYLFLGGIISSTLSCLFWYSTLQWMFGYRMGGEFGMVYLMVGLFVACIYVIYDTQIIIERAEAGDKDVPTHTLTLFMDLFDLFVKIVQLLIKLQEDGERKKRRNRDD